MKNIETAKKPNTEKRAVSKKDKKKEERELKSSTKDISSLIPIKDVVNGYFKYINNTYMGIVKLKTRDIMNASQEEIDNDMEILVHFNRVYLDDYKLISLNYPTNTKTQQAYFKDKLEHTTNEVFKEILQESYDNVREAEFNNTSRNHYIMFFGDSLKHIVENEDAIIRNLGRLAQKMSISQQIQLLFSLTNKNIPVVYDDNADKVIYNDNKDEYIKKYGYNPYLMKEICPKGNITFSHENYIKTGSGYEACVYVYGFPRFVSPHWLHTITNNYYTVSVIDVHSVGKKETTDSLNKGIAEIKTRITGARNSMESMEATEEKDKLANLAYSVVKYGEVIKRIVPRIFLYSKTLQGLEERVAAIFENLNDDEFKACININETKADWRSMFMSYDVQNKTEYKRYGKAIQSTALGIGNPLHFSELNDKLGTIYGFMPNTGGKFIFDIAQKDEFRTHYNGVVIGEMGTGKTTLLKKIIKDRSSRGDYIRVIDSVGDFSSLIRFLGGKIISFDDSMTSDSINFLQIFKTEESEQQSYSAHISKLKIIYSFIAPNSDDTERKLFIKACRTLYENKGLIPNDSYSICNLPPKKYPILSELLPVINRMLENEEIEDTKVLINNIIINIETLIKDYPHIYNRHTTIDNLVGSQIVSFDISPLSRLSDDLKDAQIYSILSLSWSNALQIGGKMKELYENNQIRWENVKRFFLIMDESHKILHTSKTLAIKQVNTFAKEGRKFFSGLIFASQSVRDYGLGNMQSEGSTELMKLFESCQYKFIFKQDTNTRNVISDAFEELTASEIEKIFKLPVGQCILNIKSVDNLLVQITATDEELAVFKGGA